MIQRQIDVNDVPRSDTVGRQHCHGDQKTMLIDYSCFREAWSKGAEWQCIKVKASELTDAALESMSHPYAATVKTLPVHA